MKNFDIELSNYKIFYLWIYLPAVVHEGVNNFDGKTGGSVLAIPSGIRWRTLVSVECYVRPCSRCRWPRLWSCARWTRICNKTMHLKHIYVIILLSTTCALYTQTFNTLMCFVVGDKCRRSISSATTSTSGCCGVYEWMNELANNNKCNSLFTDLQQWME